MVASGSSGSRALILAPLRENTVAPRLLGRGPARTLCAGDLPALRLPEGDGEWWAACEAFHTKLITERNDWLTEKMETYNKIVDYREAETTPGHLVCVCVYS